MLEHRDAFMQSLRAGPEARRRIFESLERTFGRDFSNGRAGEKLYEALHSAVEDAAIPGALAEFEGRFLPLVNGRRTPLEAEFEAEEVAVSQQTVRRKAPTGSWIPAISAVVLIGGLLALGLAVLNAVVASPSSKNKPAVSRVQAKAKEPVAPRQRPANPIRTIEGN